MLSLGPVFKTAVGISAEFEIDLDLDVAVAYSARNASAVFPPGVANDTGVFQLHDTGKFNCS